MNVLEEFVRKSKEETKRKVSLEINLGKSLFSSCVDFRISEDDFFKKISLVKDDKRVKEIKKNIYYEYFLNDLVLHVFSDGSSFCYRNKMIKEYKQKLNKDDFIACYDLMEIQNIPNDLFPSLIDYHLEKKNDSISLFFDGFMVNFIKCLDIETYYQIKIIVNESIGNKNELIEIINILKN